MKRLNNVIVAETFGGPIPVRIVSYHTETLNSAISRRWVEAQVTKSVVNPYVEGYRFICSWDNIWLKHRYTQGGLHSFYEGKPQWDPEKLVRNAAKDFQFGVLYESPTVSYEPSRCNYQAALWF